MCWECCLHPRNPPGALEHELSLGERVWRVLSLPYSYAKLVRGCDAGALPFLHSVFSVGPAYALCPPTPAGKAHGRLLHRSSPCFRPAGV